MRGARADWRQEIEEQHYNSITQGDRGDNVCSKLVKT